MRRWGRGRWLSRAHLRESVMSSASRDRTDQRRSAHARALLRRIAVASSSRTTCCRSS